LKRKTVETGTRQSSTETYGTFLEQRIVKALFSACTELFKNKVFFPKYDTQKKRYSNIRQEKFRDAEFVRWANLQAFFSFLFGLKQKQS